MGRVGSGREATAEGEAGASPLRAPADRGRVPQGGKCGCKAVRRPERDQVVATLSSSLR